MNYWDMPSFAMYLSLFLATMVVVEISSDNGFIRIKKRKKNEGALITVAIIWLLVLTLRDSSRGTDLVRYLRTYESLNATSVSEIFRQAMTAEPLYNVYVWLLKSVSSGLSKVQSTALYLFGVAVPWVIFSFMALKNESKNNGSTIAIAVIMIQFFFRSFSMLRQSIALAIMLYAFSEYAKGKKLKYWFLLLVSVGVHYTAIIGIPAYFYTDAKQGKSSILLKRTIVIIGMAVFFFFGAEILNSVFGSFDGKYAQLGSRVSSFGIGQLVNRLPFVALLVYYRKDLIAQNSHNKVYIDLMIFDVFVGQLNYVNPLFNRLSLYISALMVFLVPSLYICISKRVGKPAGRLLFFIILVVWFVLRVNYYTYENPYGIMPYISIFN